MSGPERLARLIGLQQRLAVLRLAQAQTSVATAQARADLLDDMAAGLAVRMGGHGAAQLAAQREMAERLHGARAATAQGIAVAVAERDQCHRAAQRLDKQQQRVAELHASTRHDDAASLPVPRRQLTP